MLESDDDTVATGVSEIGAVDARPFYVARVVYQEALLFGHLGNAFDLSTTRTRKTNVG